MKGKKTFNLPCRIVAVLLCLCMTTSMLFSDFSATTAYAAVIASPTEHILEGSRVADPNTMDDYRNRLLTEENGSRYAGRVWTDKTVLAYDASDANDGVSGNRLELDMETDGYDGNVGFNSDFLHVYSALASSQVVNEYPPSPIDLVIVFDMSGSMGQDTRYGIDAGGNGYVPHSKTGDSGEGWPDAGVPMAERIENSRVQKTLDAINKTIEGLMEQNPQNRVAVCGYGANATVLLPLAHYRHAEGQNTPYLSVGGMETLYHPSDLRYDDDKKQWMWMNNRDTCYTVVVNAGNEKNTYTGPLSVENTGNKWESLEKYTVSNNVLNSEGEPVKAFPGAWEDDGKTPLNKYAKDSQDVYNGAKNNDPKFSHGVDAQVSGGLVETIKETRALDADDYVGYFTNTQGGIYLAYKQLADSEDTTYSEQLSNGVMSTVARIPAAIIMSDGGANFAFNEMGNGDSSKNYTAADWNVRYGQKQKGTEASNDDPYMNDNCWGDVSKSWNTARVDGHNLDYKHRLGKSGSEEYHDQQEGNLGDEWYKVYLPGADTLGKEWDGLHGIYNKGADYYKDGTLSTAPSCYHAGVLYSSDNYSPSTSGTVLEVLLTAAYMNDVVKKHYNNGWNRDNVTKESRVELSTFTMNVDTKHVPQWGRMRLFPTLDPKDYPLDALGDSGVGKKWYEKESEFGTNEELYAALGISENADAKNLVSIRQIYERLSNAWTEWKTLNKDTSAAIGPGWGEPYITIKKISSADPNNADYKTEAKTKDGEVSEETIKVSDTDVINNIAYNDEFYDVDSSELSEIFEDILSIILGKVFVPVSGDNDAGVGNSITYQDPLGEYMEIKNQSVTATPYHTGEELPPIEITYDMSMLLFGEMHGLVRTGVYDYHWNDDYMKEKKPTEQGKTAFTMGWYKGEDVSSAEYGGNDVVPNQGGYKNEDAAKAWADGWVYRLDYKTAAQYVPIIAEAEKETPENLPEQMKNTVYTMYRFSCNENDRNQLRRNPIYGDVPEDLEEKWEEAYRDNNDEYPEGNTIYAETPGVYRLSDIRVWVEDTGDFVDTDGAIAPESGYERSLYMNVPAAAVPTELATITMGKDGVKSYKTNLGSDHPIGSKDMGVGSDGKEGMVTVSEEMYENYCYQSTPLRLFYAVGLEEDLILRDSKGEQMGVDITALSEEYVKEHTDENNNIYFISNYFSNTAYDDYVTDSEEPYTRGDPTVSFSPSEDNRYYVFQKPLPLYAHAYRVQSDGSLTSVDGEPPGGWPSNKSGNGNTTWEKDKKGGGGWAGGEFMGVYESKDAFKTAYNSAKENKTIEDNTNTSYPLVEDGIVFLKGDLLEHVTSDNTGYTEGSVAFNSDDYFFLLVEYYKPDGGTGKDIDDEPVYGTQEGHAVQYAVARKGSEFGSGFASDKIDNGDMLCWTDMNNHLNLEIDYLSRTDTGDDTRGEPTYEKLFTNNDNDSLKNYLKGLGIRDDNVSEDEQSSLDKAVKYWLGIQEEYADVLKQADSNDDGNVSKDEFNAYFKFAVAARPGGIRTGDMANNVQNKSDNVTMTARNYYLPTVSDNSGTDKNVIIDNYLGNNGRLAIANSMLLVTKLFTPPEGLSLTTEQKNEEFLYQLFVQGLTGVKNATKVHYNPFSKTWQRQVAYIDVLTDNSSLLQDSNNERALFAKENGTVKQVVRGADGSYYYAGEDGKASTKPYSGGEEGLYYLYLPSNGATSGEGTELTRRLYQDSDYNGDDKDEVNDKNKLTIYYGEGASPPSEGGNTEYEKATAEYLAGTYVYWAADALLISRSTVTEDWEYNSGGESLSKYPLVISKPTGDTSENDISSPFKTRTMYMTQELNFGQNANKDGTDSGPLTENDLYDEIIPKGDRPDLFGNLDNNKIAENTAEFTLKSGEGLLLTGLQNRIVYRYTEKLTEEQLANGYTIGEISHVQQRGSDSIYRPGVQKIPVYYHDGATYGSCYPSVYQNERTVNGLTWALDRNGNPNQDQYRSEEPFNHANAVMWEYYATMKAGEAGNHHQPKDSEPEKSTFYNNQGTDTKVTDQVENNPSCKPLNEGGCDVAVDGSIRHYIYKDGQLVDPHYEGEASAFLRNMSRFLVSTTVHFGVKNEEQKNAESTPPYATTGNDYNYNGVYSVFGNTGYFEEQAHFVNTIESGRISITKELKADDGVEITDQDRNQSFEFTLTLTPPSGQSVDKDKVSGPFSYTITQKNDDGTEETVKSGRLLPNPVPEDLDPKEDGNDIKASSTDESDNPTWNFKLKGGQTMTVGGLPVKTGFSYAIAEDGSAGYKVTDSEATEDTGGSEVNSENTGSGNEDNGDTGNGGASSDDSDDEEDSGESGGDTKVKHTVSGEVGAGEKEPVQVTFTNTKQTPKAVDVNLDLTKNLTLEEGITDNGYGIMEDDYTFQVIPKSGNPADDPIETIKWNENTKTGWNGNSLIVKNEAPEQGKSQTTAGAKIFENLTYKKPGTYVYTVTEQVSSLRGVSSDAAAYTVTVNVEYGYEKDEGDNVKYTGKLVAKVTVEKDGVSTGESGITFNNTIKEGSIDVPLRARKEFNGDLKAGMFTFQLTSVSAKYDEPESVSNSGGQSEIISGDSDMQNDSSNTADDSPGSADDESDTGDNGSDTGDSGSDTAGDSPETQDGEPMPIVGDPAPGPEFTPIPPTGKWEQTNTADGWVNFGTITFEKPGIYTYELREIADNISDIRYSTAVYSIIITITKDDSTSNLLRVKNIEYKISENGDGDWKDWDGTTLGLPLFVNEVKTGSLHVEKSVTGSGDRTQEFNFTVELSNDNYSFDSAVITKNGEKSDLAIVAIGKNGTLEFTLKDGEYVEITGLPAGTTYTVKETEANEDGYTTTVTDSDDNNGDGKGTIKADTADEVKFVNDKPTPTTPPPSYPTYGSLTVTKTVTGEAGDTAQSFAFRVQLGQPLSGTYGGMTFNNGVAEFTLKHGESATASGLPAGVTYTVTETGANEDGYETSSTGAAGMIPAGGTATAEYVNHREEQPPEENCGNLVVTKTVTGSAGSTSRKWHFRVKLSDKSISGQYGDMFFDGGVAEFTLKHGESAEALNLPADITYTVTETEADKSGYDTSSTGSKGVIPDGGTATAKFVNDKEGDTPPPDDTPTPPDDTYDDIPPDDVPHDVLYDTPEPNYPSRRLYDRVPYVTPGVSLKPSNSSRNTADESTTHRKDSVPGTGDESRTGFWMVLMLVSLTGAAVISVPLARRVRYRDNSTNKIE